MNDPSRATGNVFANTQAIQERLDELGWSRNEFASRSRVPAGTISRMMNGTGVSRHNALKLAAALDGKIPDYFRATKKIDDGRRFELPPTEEWDVKKHLSDWIVASNGLRFRVCEMTHRHTPIRKGRGKFYSLLGIRGEERKVRGQMLTRHAIVSSAVGLHPRIAENLSCVPTVDGNGWWVIDRWIKGEALDERLDRSPLAESEVRSLAAHILKGLAALHKVQVVFRELAPSHVIVTPDGSAVLTDFELAKLFDGSPSVKPGDWPDDPYRAPEVESGRFKYRADLFSWGRIMTRCALGDLPSVGEDAKRLATCSLPKGVRETVRACLAINPDDRPESVDKILPIIARWK